MFSKFRLQTIEDNLSKKITALRAVMREASKYFKVKEECGRTLRNSNRGWIKRTIVFLKYVDEFRPRSSKEECSKRFKRIENRFFPKDQVQRGDW